MICEPCNECTCVKCVPTCTDELVLGMISLGNTAVFVYFLNSNTERVDKFNAISEVDGTVKVDLSSFQMMPDTNYEVWITTTTATSFLDMLTITIGLDTLTCMEIEFVDVNDSSNPEDQISYTSQTVELCTPTVDPNAPTLCPMLCKDFILTSAQILDIHNTDVEIIPAPGPGKAIVTFNIGVGLDYNSVDYVGGDASGIRLFYGTDKTANRVHSITRTTVRNSGDIANTHNADTIQGGGVGVFPIINQPITAGMTGTPFTLGDSDVKGTIFYQIATVK